MNVRMVPCWATGLSVCLVVAMAGAQSAQIHLLAGPGEVTALDTSADGGVVCGLAREAPAGQTRWFRWTLTDGMQWVGVDDGLENTAFGISGDGTTLVGRSGLTAHSWNAVDGTVDLGSLDGRGDRAYAYGASFDGSVIVGNAGVGNTTYGFVWRESTGMVELDWSGGGSGISSATDVTHDGLTIVGRVRDTNETFQPSVWTQGTGWGVLPNTPDWNVNGQTRSVSSDGDYMVGMVTEQGGPREAFLYAAATESFTLLEQDINPDGDFFVMDVSDDGGLVVGLVELDASNDRAVIWDPNNGVRLLSDVLEQDYNTDMLGWTLLTAKAISRDGTVITGEARHDGFNHTISYVAIIPAPGGVAALSVVAGVLGVRRRRV